MKNIIFLFGLNEIELAYSPEPHSGEISPSSLLPSPPPPVPSLPPPPSGYSQL